MPTGDTDLHIHAFIHRLLRGIVSTSRKEGLRLLSSNVVLRCSCKMEITVPVIYHNYGVSMGYIRRNVNHKGLYPFHIQIQNLEGAQCL